MKLHVHNHTGAKWYSCRHCSECSVRLDQLKTHLLKSHDEDSWLTCHICQKNFSHSGNLKKHVRRHKAVKPYVCSDCSKHFCTAGELNNHVRATFCANSVTHTENKKKHKVRRKSYSIHGSNELAENTENQQHLTRVTESHKKHRLTKSSYMLAPYAVTAVCYAMANSAQQN